MKTRVAINGFGRIGRNAFKIAFARSDVQIVAVNDLTDTKTLAYLLKHDSNYGTYDKEVGFDEQHLIVDGQKIVVLAERDPAALPWQDHGIDVVIESTGFFTDKEGASKHIAAGAKRVVISGPTKSEGVDTIVLGANDDKLGEATEVTSNASCTTNSLGAVMAVLESEFGVEKSLLTTVHSYTASQALQDAPKKDLREGRNAAENIVPTTTGAAMGSPMCPCADPAAAATGGSRRSHPATAMPAERIASRTRLDVRCTGMTHCSASPRHCLRFTSPRPVRRG